MDGGEGKSPRNSYVGQIKSNARVKTLKELKARPSNRLELYYCRAPQPRKGGKKKTRTHGFSENNDNLLLYVCAGVVTRNDTDLPLIIIVRDGPETRRSTTWLPYIAFV